jgi:autotransporter family porin
MGTKSLSIDEASASLKFKFQNRVDGKFTGTTDEIIQWGACKWGFDEDIIRAQAVQESNWRQREVGDGSNHTRTCRVIGKTAPCWQSYGLFQVKSTVHLGTYPLAERSTAFNTDYTLGWLRVCYEGGFGWLGAGYSAGDEWGCIGAWYSGKWHDERAEGYVKKVRKRLAAREWTNPSF